MEMEFSKLERVVGTFIVGVALLLMATLVIIGRGKDWFENYITYYTAFGESYNLQENAAVKLFKADIGKVVKITLEKNRVQVKLAILEKYAARIRQNAVAVVESPTLIGSEYIAIIPGSTDAPAIAPEGEIASREKRSITDILTEFEVEKTALLVVKAIQDISQVTQRLGDPKGPLIASLENIEKVSANVQRITTDLDAGKGPMGMLLKSEDVLKRLVESIDRMGQILSGIQATTAQAPQTMALVQENLVALQANMDEANRILTEIKAITTDLKAGSRNIPQISATFKEGIQEVRQGVEQTNRVVEALQNSYLIRGNLPPEPIPAKTDAGARP
ncbi:MAG: MCE family protein [Desulfobacterales bacterium]|nr:MCE family protein [Desulfobacterales bacterium]